ncbi:hypothetical protein [Terriglobus roseus]|uniref:Phage tail protein (Tail_P2_I) n=1 Tax=Terriglobus roseus TaxID=392734 RepID=A0A1H4IYM0_9BACT|nr:hypothetical protein [Terriglobus roseus]SEB38706.1 hypothetical protein SAMN05443244_0175 [Terriglobus roseus]
MKLTGQDLMRLLPAVHGIRDAAAGGPLEALLDVLGEQAGIVEDNILQLYEDQFIETSSTWAVPYIGDLIGYLPIQSINGAFYSPRAEVANTIGYRRRKGTAIALEQVCSDVSGRPVHLAERFKTTFTLQSMRCITPSQPAFAPVRSQRTMERIGTAFDSVSHRADVRRISPRLRAVATPDMDAVDIALHGGGQFNLPNIALHLWRCRSFLVEKAPVLRVDDGRYTFDLAGLDIPLFSAPTLRTPFDHITTRMDVPQPISLREVQTSADDFYGETKSLYVWIDGVAVDPQHIAWKRLSGDEGRWCAGVPGRVTVDVQCGRIALAPEWGSPSEVLVRFAYGFAADIGGGAYDRSVQLTADTIAGEFLAIVGSPLTPTVEDAVALWNAQPEGTTGSIVFVNYARIDCEEALQIRIPAGSALTILAATAHSANGVSSGFTGAQSQVTLAADLLVTGEASASNVNTGRLALNGLRLLGSIAVGGEAIGLSANHCTVLPDPARLHAAGAEGPREPSFTVLSAGTSLTMERTLTGPLAVVDSATVMLCEVLLDAGSPCCIAYAGAEPSQQGGDLQVENSTVIGKVRTRTMPLASNTIFRARLARNDSWPAAVWCGRTQTGCVRFCSLPFASITPRRYQCLPTSLVNEGALSPMFVSLRYGHPAYGLLATRTPLAVWHGADDGGQIGVMHGIQESEAVQNMQLRIPEFLPAGMEAGVFLVTPTACCEGPRRHPHYGVRVVPEDCCENGASDEGVSGIGIRLL